MWTERSGAFDEAVKRNVTYHIIGELVSVFCHNKITFIQYKCVMKESI